MGGEIRGLVIMALLVAMVSIGLSTFLGGLSSEYPGMADNVSADDFSYFDQSERVYNLTESLSANIQTQETSGTDILDIPFMIISGGYTSLMLVFGAGDLVIALVSGIGIVASSVGISLDWAIGIILTIVAVIVAFAILNAILSKKEV